MTASLVSTSGLSVAIGGKVIIADVALSVQAGEFLAIVGPNGAGKTTLLRAIVGLLPATGVITFGGKPMAQLSVRERARRIAYLPQGHVFHWPLPVSDVVALGRLPNGAGADLSDADRVAVARALTATGTTEFAERPVTTLSGGERARVALARVLATEAPVILADEPTASLDVRYQLAVMDILRRHAEAGGAVVAVLHDLALAARSADRMLLMDRGRVVAEGAPGEILQANRLAEVFGVVADVIEVDRMPVVIPRSIVT